MASSHRISYYFELILFAACQDKTGNQLCLIICDFGFALHVGNLLFPMSAGVLLWQVQVVATSAVIGIQCSAKH